MTTPHEATPDQPPGDATKSEPGDFPVTHPGGDPGDVAKRKATARTAIRAARREQLAAAGPDARSVEAAALVNHGMAWLAEHERHRGSRVNCVTAYQEMATEPPMSAFVQGLIDRGINVLVPVTLPDGVLRWRPVQPGRHDNPMTPQRGDAGNSSRDEPGESRGTDALADVDVAFIPALALGSDGTRLGQGGGYYDRAIPALRAMRPDVPVLAVLFSNEVGQDVPALEHDIRVDAALTPEGVERLTGMRAGHTFEANT